MLRTFVGLRCGPAVSRQLHKEALALKAIEGGLRVPAVEDLHMTLQFLGETLMEDVTEIDRALREAAAGIPPLELDYRGLGAFPAPERARVIWAGVEDEDGVLQELVTRVGSALGQLGYPKEKRRYHAHVTLARVRKRPSPELLAALESGSGRDYGSEVLSDLKLIVSAPGNQPYHYIDLKTVELEG